MIFYPTKRNPRWVIALLIGGVFFLLFLPTGSILGQSNGCDSLIFKQLIAEGDRASSFEEKFEKYELAASEGIYCTEAQRALAIRKQKSVLKELDRVANEAKGTAEENRLQALRNERLAEQADSTRQELQKVFNDQQEFLQTLRSENGYSYLVDEGNKALIEEKFEQALINFSSARLISKDPTLDTLIQLAKGLKLADSLILNGFVFEAVPLLENTLSVLPDLPYAKSRLAVLPSLDSLISVGLNNYPLEVANKYIGPAALYFLPEQLKNAPSLEELVLFRDSIDHIPNQITSLAQVSMVKLHDYQVDNQALAALSGMASLDTVHFFKCSFDSTAQAGLEMFEGRTLMIHTTDSLLNLKLFSRLGESLDYYLILDQEEEVLEFHVRDEEFLNKIGKARALFGNRIIDNREFVRVIVEPNYLSSSMRGWRYDNVPVTTVTDFKLLSWDSHVQDSLITSIKVDGSLDDSGLIFSTKNDDRIFAHEDRIMTWRQNRWKYKGQKHWLPYRTFYAIGHDQNSFSNYSNLKELSLTGFNEFPFYIRDITSIEKLHLTKFNNVENLLDSIYELKHLKSLHIDAAPLRNLPSSFSELSNLNHLSIKVRKPALIQWSEIFELQNLKTLKIQNSRDWWIYGYYRNGEFRRYFNPRKFKLRGYKKETKSLSSLKEVIIYNVNVKYKIDVFLNMPELHRLEIVGCHYSQRLKTKSIGSNISYLSLRGNKLTKVHRAFLIAPSLDTLDMSFNRIRSIAEVSESGSLRVLDLEGNKLRSLPFSIKNLCYIEALDLSRNRLSQVSESIGYLSLLNYLDLSDNKLKTLANLREHQLENLEYLDLSGNKLEELPESIGCLSNLDSLNLSRNKLLNLPNLTENHLVNVEYLNLSNNRLSELPDWVFKLPNLKSINLEDNRFVESEADRISNYFYTQGVKCEISHVKRGEFKQAFKEGWQDMKDGVNTLFGRD